MREKQERTVLLRREPMRMGCSGFCSYSNKQIMAELTGTNRIVTQCNNKDDLFRLL
jgi:hypothetical protein